MLQSQANSYKICNLNPVTCNLKPASWYLIGNHLISLLRMQLSVKHLLGIRDLTRQDIQIILDTATQFKEVLQRPIKKVPSLRDVTIVNLFFENSTRTRISFELAEKRLSADTINFTASASSVSKGETLLDTVNNILSMKVDMVVMWYSVSGVPYFLTQ